MGKYIVLFVSLILSFPAHSAKLTMGKVINTAGQQRMLTQRMIKAYVQLGYKVRIGSANKQLLEATERFDDNLSMLSTIASTAEEKNTIGLLHDLWSPLKATLYETPTKDEAEFVNELGEALLEESQHFVDLIVMRSTTKSGRLTALSGRQRMLSQRIAKYYLLQCWVGKRDDYTENYNTSVKQFSDALEQLNAQSTVDNDIELAMKSLTNDWKTFKLSNKTLGRCVPALVTRSTDRIMDKANGATELFAQLKVDSIDTGKKLVAIYKKSD